MLDKTSSIICAFGLAAAAPRSPYRHLELCGIALRRFSSCFGFQYLQRSGTVKTVPYRMFWSALLTCKISVGRCARRRVSEARLTGNARQFAKQTRSCSCKTHWVLHCSPSHFRKLKAIPHNSKCRYGERGAAAAKPKAQIILDVLSSILATQMPYRSRRSSA